MKMMSFHPLIQEKFNGEYYEVFLFNTENSMCSSNNACPFLGVKYNTLPVLQVQNIDSYGNPGTKSVPKNFGTHTNFYDSYVRYQYKILV